MFEFLFFVTAIYMAYVAYEAYQAVGRAEKGEPVFKPRPAVTPKAVAQPAAAKTTAPALVATKAAPKAATPVAKPAEPAAVTKSTPAPKPAPAAKVAAAKPAKAPAKSEAPKPVAKAPEPKTTPAKPAAAPAAPVAMEATKLTDEFRNPATGEVSPVPANYRFAKKWIKDALVSEKLLDRVYKPNELDDAASKKVKEAIEKLRAIKKYHT
ncbi:MAG: hypothetical protein RLZZ09_517 [Pseudomonadota bacterium]|jgi:hypothetical protein